MDSIKKRKAKEIALIAKLQRYESETSNESNHAHNLKYTKLIEKHRRRSLAQFANEERLMSSTPFSNLGTNRDLRDAIEESRRECLNVINYRNNHSWNAAFKVYQRRNGENDKIPETHNNVNTKRSHSRDVDVQSGFLPSLASSGCKVLQHSSSFPRVIAGPKLLETFPITKDEVYKKYTHLLPKKSRRILPVLKWSGGATIYSHKM
ncbi:hypothetical protein ACJMK2_012012 [Sinanodonta woodiana]|uniref:Uncharacterized protein n=1 Tax=Sinanodonta woodiana TaxID=1069815 RepID=A0ABD3V6V2_SINWO